MIEQLFSDIATPQYTDGAILNQEYDGFLQDYLCLHALIMRYKPNSFLECGTNCGVGTNIIANAIYSYNPNAEVYSLDLPTELAHVSLQHPISEGKGDRVGANCNRKFTQLRGDSLTFEFSKYPCEGWYLDSEHDFEHPFRESMAAFMHEPKLIVWHDSDMPEVWRAITTAFSVQRGYELYRITDTRISYSIPL